MKEEDIIKSAIFSAESTYRWILRRSWDRNKPSCLFIGLNSSIADAIRDDPTIRRCIRFAQDWDCGSLAMVNLFAFCTTDPSVLSRVSDPVGRLNDGFIRQELRYAQITVAAWGAHKIAESREKAVIEMQTDNGQLQCLGLTKEGKPRHPLYIKANTPLIAFDRGTW